MKFNLVLIAFFLGVTLTSVILFLPLINANFAIIENAQKIENDFQGNFTNGTLSHQSAANIGRFFELNENEKLINRYDGKIRNEINIDQFVNYVIFENQTYFNLLNSSEEIFFTNNMTFASEISSDEIDQYYDDYSEVLIIPESWGSIPESVLRLKNTEKVIPVIILNMQLPNQVPIFVLFNSTSAELLPALFYHSNSIDFHIDIPSTKLDVVTITELEDIVLTIYDQVRINSVLANLDDSIELENLLSIFIQNEIQDFRTDLLSQIGVLFPLIQLVFIIYIILINSEFDARRYIHDILHAKGATFKQILKFELTSNSIYFTGISIGIGALIFIIGRLFQVDNGVVLLISVVYFIIISIYIIAYISIFLIRSLIDRLTFEFKKEYKISKNQMVVISLIGIALILLLNVLAITQSLPIVSSILNLQLINNVGLLFLLMIVFYLLQHKNKFILRYHSSNNFPNDLWYSVIKSNKRLKWFLPLIFLLLVSTHFSSVLIHNVNHSYNLQEQEIYSFSDDTFRFTKGNPALLRDLLLNSSIIDEFAMIFEFEFNSLIIDQNSEYQLKYIVNPDFLISKYPFQRNQFEGKNPTVLRSIGNSNRVIIDQELSFLEDSGIIHGELLNRSSLNFEPLELKVASILNYKLPPGISPSIYMGNSTIQLSEIQIGDGLLFLNFNQLTTQNEIELLFNDLNSLPQGRVERDIDNVSNNEILDLVRFVTIIIVVLVSIASATLSILDRNHEIKYYKLLWEKGVEIKDMTNAFNFQVILNSTYDTIILTVLGLIPYGAIIINENSLAGEYFPSINLSLFFKLLVVTIVIPYLLSNLIQVIVNRYYIKKWRTSQSHD